MPFHKTILNYQRSPPITIWYFDCSKKKTIIRIMVSGWIFWQLPNQKGKDGVRMWVAAAQNRKCVILKDFIMSVWFINRMIFYYIFFSLLHLWLKTKARWRKACFGNNVTNSSHGGRNDISFWQKTISTASKKAHHESQKWEDSYSRWDVFIG